MNQVQPPIRVARDPLITATCVLLIVAVFGFATETVWQHVASAAAHATQGARAGELEIRAYSTGNAAHVTLTNLNAFDSDLCFRGVVATKKGLGKARSAIVCTGIMKPRTSVFLEAPYDPGAVESVCAGETNGLGMRQIDWDRCTFTTEPVSAPPDAIH
jgi:hypothetical protein